MIEADMLHIQDLLDHPVSGRPIADVYEYIHGLLSVNGAPAPDVNLAT